MSANGQLRQKAYDFIAANRLASLATADAKGLPHVAPVYCVVDEDMSIFFSTRVEGRKFINLQTRPTVAMSFIDETNISAIQLTGTAKRINNMKLESEIMERLAFFRYQETLPIRELYLERYTNELAIIKVTPTEMTLANFANPETGRYKAFFHKII